MYHSKKKENINITTNFFSKYANGMQSNQGRSKWDVTEQKFSIK